MGHDIDWLTELWGVAPLTDAEMAQAEAEYQAAKAATEARRAERRAAIAALPAHRRPLSEAALHATLTRRAHDPLACAGILWLERDKLRNLPR